MRGASGQLYAHVVRVLGQFVYAGVLLPVWGLQLYGEWVILIGIAVVVGSSDFGYISAAVSDMNMAVGRGDRDHALDVFRTIARGLVIVSVLVLVAAALAVTVVPITHVLGLGRIHETGAAAIVLMIAVDILVTVFGNLLYGGFSCVGRYGAGIALQSTIILGETAGACVAAASGGGPVLATAAILAMRVTGTVGMYAAMRRRAPWLSIGRPAGRARVRKRLTGPALAMASTGWGTTLNVQLTVVIVGVVIGPASAAIFSTIRTLSRVVLQITASIAQAVGPELSRAYAIADSNLAARLQRRVTQAAVWSLVAMSTVLALLGPTFLPIWTHGRVRETGMLLDLLLVAAALEGAWVTAGSIMFFTNRHQRIGLAYAILSLANIPLAYLLAGLAGSDGVAVSVVAVSGLMLAYVLRLSLPTVQETALGWVRSLVHPVEIWRAASALRFHIASLRASRGADTSADRPDHVVSGEVGTP